MKTFVKTIAILLMIASCSLKSSAQFKLSGKIVNYKGKEKLAINIPLVSGFYQENTIQIPINAQGSFSVILPVQQSKFANLIFQKKFYSLLVKPNKNLVLHLDQKDSSLTVLSGSALAKNKVMQAINLEEYPFFLVNEANNPLVKLNFNDIKEQVIRPYFAKRYEKIKKVNASNISLSDKQLIASELTYISYNYLNDLARTQISNRALVDSLVFEIFDSVDPKPLVFPAGPQYYAFVRSYLSYQETKAFKKIAAEKIKPNEAIPYFGISLDSANVIVKNYGKPYWRWVGSNQFFPVNVVEVYNYHQIVGLFIDKDLRQFEALAKVFKAKFPKSNYLQDITNKGNQLQQTLAQNENNSEIQLVANYEKISSIYEVIKPFKGKTIYLDVWGTWCGPCKEELTYVPALKTRFKDKDVVFIYLDLDDEHLDAAWRQFIKLNNMSGVHLRKNRQSIVPFWKELLADASDKAEYYPQYFIFDREGKLVHAKAKRPSDKEELYSQIEKVLNKK